MKKVFILSFVALILSLSTQADDGSAKSVKNLESISDNTLRQFGSIFYRASDVKWSINSSYQKATFTLNGKPSYAIYDHGSQLLVATQNVSTEELPSKAQHSLKANYADFKIIKAVKVISRPSDYKFNDDTDHYWVSLVNDNKQVFLLISPSSDITLVSTKTLGS